jgi:hypothetical protein
MKSGQARIAMTRLGPPAILALLAAAALAVRLTALRALPVFGDEATFLHLARLLRADPSGNLWVSLQVALAPLHVWALALVLPVSADPVLAGRLLSVATGIALVPVLFWAAVRMGEFLSVLDDEPGRVRQSALWAAAILAVSPFFVFADRLARVDSLFALEVAVVTAVSIDLAQAAAAPLGSVVAHGLALGVCMGITMLTRQAVSYPLWALPVLAFLLRPKPHGEEHAAPAPTGRLLLALGIALCVAGALWIPMLVARRPEAPDMMTRIFSSAEYRPGMDFPARAELSARNLRIALAAFGRYLTPPICFAAVAGALALSRPGSRRLLLFLAAWEALLITPAALFAVGYFPRFALAAALPLVVSAGFGVTSVLSWVGTARPAAARGAVAAGLLGVLLVWPLVVIVRGEHDWTRWSLLPIDRQQFVTGPQAGFATEETIRFLEAEAAKGPVTVLTPEFSGNPTDALWLYLADRRGIRLSYAVDALRTPLLDADPREPNVVRLAGDLRARVPPRSVVLPGGEPVYAVSTDPLLTRAGWAKAESVLAPSNPGLNEIARFENPRDADEPEANAVVLYRVR